jgi:Methyltransferase domain
MTLGLSTIHIGVPFKHAAPLLRRLFQYESSRAAHLVYLPSLPFPTHDHDSFEKSILEALPECEVHTFDHTITPKGVPRGVNFHGWGLAAADGGKMKTLSTMTRELGHDKPGMSIEILKIDVEGHEWDVLNPLLEARDLPFARQLLIELHPTELKPTRRFFELMYDAGYEIAHKEPNTYQGGTLQEYNFILLNLPKPRNGTLLS